MPIKRRLIYICGLLAYLACTCPASAQDAKPDSSALEFFEKSVRPVLVTRCISCHGDEKQKGGLRLDSRAALMSGGESGPAIVPGKPMESRLVDAINYGDLQMPPKSKLPAVEIQSLTKWVEMNAPWPESLGPKTGATTSTGKPWAERKKHWSLQPVADPALPNVKDTAWPHTPIDRFILAGLESSNLKPTHDADRRTWIRRVTFDLTGLPPTIDEIDGFLKDTSSNAQEKVVDHLLASPRYGERWARHWLDLVRYAETSGHEFDYDLPDAWRYRDYVIRAFNADLPYNQFVTEHIAGDLLEKPRCNPVDGSNESILATGFFYLCEGTHSPVDLRDEEAARIDNQLDVFAKTFQGLTLACARCHDHKFDAITTKDYYALSGVLKSSRHHHAILNEDNEIKPRVAALDELKSQVVAAAKPTTPPLKSPAPIAASKDVVVFESFNTPNYQGWNVARSAFGNSPTGTGDYQLSKEPALVPLKPGLAHSGRTSPRLHGSLRSRTFTIEHPFILFLTAGSGGRINVVIDGFEKIRSPIYGGLLVDVNNPQPHWQAIDVTMWIGHEAYIELSDGATIDYSGGNSRYSNGSGDLIVDEIVFAKSPGEPGPVTAFSGPKVPITDPKSRSLAERYRTLESQLPAPIYALAITEGTPENDRVHIRGNPRSLGDVVPRRFVEAIDTSASGSAPISRRDLAQKLVDPANPLTARVMVNRIWKHHFGEGLVRSTDDYGAMGQTPSNPQLLDWLAREFIRSGWSIKHMHKLMVLSHTYALSSAADTEGDKADPANRLLHRMNVRRLEAEAVRDSVLAVSGRLDPTMFGPSIPVHLTPFMDGRGRPGHSGPEDGNGRRTIYQNVRRNFVAPFLLAFDFPTPSSCTGRRNVSNIPAQALTMLNDPFVVAQAKLWAERVSKNSAAPDEQITQLYLTAFGRPPSAKEKEAAIAYIASQTKNDKSAAWADLCHVLFNVKEFIFIP